MKKTTKVATGVAALALVTTSFVGGTFAKYVTGTTGKDTARVAKFGVELDAGSDFFNSAYQSTDDDYGVSVNSVEADENVIAPGTSGEAAAFSITGTPEVAVRVAVTLDEDDALHMVTLPGGTYQDYTLQPIDEENTFEVGEDGYYPVHWKLEHAQTKDGDYTMVTEGNLQKIEDYFAGNLEDNQFVTDYAPNTDLATVLGHYKLSWDWDFDNDGTGTYDQHDTYLGQVAAGVVEDIPDGVDTVESFGFHVTVTQID